MFSSIYKNKRQNESDKDENKHTLAANTFQHTYSHTYGVVTMSVQIKANAGRLSLARVQHVLLERFAKSCPALPGIANIRW